MKPVAREWIAKAEADFLSAQREFRARKHPNYDAACFFGPAVCHSARQNRPLIGAQNRPPCGWYSVEESSYSVLLARGVIRS
jgi:hypothetical protein